MTESWISCEEVVERLVDYLHQELDNHTSAEIERHLERCHDCFSRAEFERRLRERIARSGQQEAPERLRRRIREMIDHF
ncbi:zf-HC2 domain-containing protein [Marinobacter sp. 71-i]|uniref:Zf-HC2 domain-containing protein n=1 Tax=Marinobacter iranensis TaxID=2962607 RepID=A0ABT5YBF8_9GAMM|nr:zf-HC2 domain-containing protein [Marinobacter iranensis]MDF0751027.1 zf-HC2 domain-containing protein [Marinobacter iranensis]